MFNDNITSSIIDFVKKDDFILSLVETGPRTDPTVEKTELLDYNYAFGTENISKYRSKKFFLEDLEDEFLIVQKRDISLPFLENSTKDIVNYVIITKDMKRLNLTFIQNHNIQKYVNNMSMAKVLVDKKEVIDKEKIPVNKIFVFEKPSEEDYIKCCNDFFINVLNIGIALSEGKILYGINRYYEDVKNRLDTMTAYYIGCMYDFRVDVGKNYENFKLYLDREHYDRYLQTYPTPDRENLWLTIFNACMLFRKEGLVVAENMGYEYTKLEDREILVKLRKLWNKHTGK